MKKYFQLLTFDKTKAFSISNKRWINQTVSIRSQHHLRHPQPPPRPRPWPPSPATSASHYYRSYLHDQISTLHTLRLSNDDQLIEGNKPLDFEVTVKNRDVIFASHGPEKEFWLAQSNLDLLLPPLHPGAFFCYKKKDDTKMSTETIVNTIKKSLAGALSSFYPLAGEIVLNSQGEPEVLCNNNGVEFVHAHADVELKTLDLHHPDEAIKGKLVPEINHGVFSVQVTELNCGAIILSCSFDHRIADANSFNMFLLAWAEFAQFKQISKIPYFRPSILNPRRPPRYDPMLDNLFLPISSLGPPPPPSQDQLRSRFYYIQSESINRLQYEASSQETRRSKLQSFTAFVWKLIAQEGHNDTNTKSRMGLIVNGRQHLTGKSEEESSMLANRFGNVLSIPYGEELNRRLKEMSLKEVANKVNQFVSKAINEEHFRGLIDWVELHRPEPAVARIYFKLHETDGDAVVVSSGQGLPIKDMNFGWGVPDFGSYHFPWGGETGYITTMPSAAKDGDWVVYVHLKQKHLDLIESKARHVFKPLTQSYLRFH